MKAVSLRALFASALLLTPLVAFSAQSATQYPIRPVRMIVPFQPGGASDFVARIVQDKLASERTCAAAASG